MRNQSRNYLVCTTFHRLSLLVLPSSLMDSHKQWPWPTFSLYTFHTNLAYLSDELTYMACHQPISFLHLRPHGCFGKSTSSAAVQRFRSTPLLWRKLWVCFMLAYFHTTRLHGAQYVDH